MWNFSAPQSPDAKDFVAVVIAHMAFQTWSHTAFFTKPCMKCNPPMGSDLQVCLEVIEPVKMKIFLFQVKEVIC